MALSEEEKYREKVRQEIKEGNTPEKKKKKGKGCLFWIIVFIIFVTSVSVISNSVSKNGSSGSSSSTTNTTSQEELDGNVSFDGTQFHITNLGKSNWEACYFTLNDKYHYPSRTSDWVSGPKIEIIKSGEKVSVGFLNFTLNDGTRFNAFQKKPQSFSVSCKNGFNVWG